MKKIANIVKMPILWVFRRITGFIPWFKKASWKKRIAATIAILIILLILKNVLFPSSKNIYSFDTISRGTVSQLVTENGNIVSGNETDVYSPTNGVLDTIYVHNGDHVQKGQNLLTVRSTATAQEQAVAYANYEAALNTLSQSNAELYTLQNTLFVTNQKFVNDRGINNPSSQQQADPVYIEENDAWLAAEAAYKNQVKAIAAAQAAASSTYLAYQATQNTTITAPISGTVSNLVGIKGAKVLAQLNSSVTSATNVSTSQSGGSVTPILIIGDTTGTSLKTTVSEVDVNKIAIGDTVSVNFSSIQNKTFQGTVIQADTYGSSVNGVISYNVFITLQGSDIRMRPNMTANITIYTAKRENVLTVANTAIVPYQNGNAVQVLEKNGKVRFLPVSIGLQGFTRSEILNGVTSGEKVILGNTQLSTTNGS